MTRLLCILLTLLFSLSGPAMGVNSDFGHSTLAARGAGTLDDLSKAASAADRGGLTKAGRAVQKHGDRAGSAFPQVKGGPGKLNPANRSISRSPTQNARAQADITRLEAEGATDIRVNQQQVNAAGERVGTNRPDVQYTIKGQRHHIEYDTNSSSRGASHQQRILANDPGADVKLIRQD